MNVEIIDLPYLCETFPYLPKDEISRDIYIETVKRTLENQDLIFIEGESGSGKTTFLAQFAKDNNFNTVSYFITSSFKYSYNPLSFKSDIFKQLFFYATGNVIDEAPNIDDNDFNSIYNLILKKIRKSGEPLYFVLDGLGEIEAEDLNILKSTLNQLPWTKAKFIVSGSSEKLNNILPPKIKYKTFTPSYFNLAETKFFFKDFHPTEEEIIEIYSICGKGMPERLVQVKRICREAGDIKNFLSNDFTPKTDLFEFEWNNLSLNHIQKEALAIMIFDEAKIALKKLSLILNEESSSLLTKLDKIPFLECTNDFIELRSESLKKYLQKQLHEYKDQINEVLIKYYTKHPNSEESLYNLPAILQRAKKWQELVNYLSVKGFVNFIEKTQSISSIKRQFEYGLDASKNFNKFTGEYLRFALHKSSVRELEKVPVSQTEIEARIAIGDYGTANDLANSALLKEDRIKLLANIAKSRKERKLADDKLINDQIKDLYDQIDWSIYKEEILEISGLLLYSYPDLAIELIEKNSTTEENKILDLKLAYLSLSAIQANTKTKTNIANVDLISSKIKDKDTKSYTDGLKFISEEFDSDQIIDQIEQLSNNTRKIFILRNWISNNKNKKGIEKVVTHALNLIISSAAVDVPNASSLSEIASPLPFIEDTDAAIKIIQLLDSQKKTIVYPTIDFIALQLTIAESFFTFDEERGKDRIYEIFLLIEDTDDLSIKVDCLSLLWAKLISLDKNGEIQKSLTSNSSLEIQVKSHIEQLLNETAYHYEMVDKVIYSLVQIRPDFIFATIKLINTEDRRDHAYYLAIIIYIRLSTAKIDFDHVSAFYNEIKQNYLKERVFLSIVERLLEEKEETTSTITKIKKYIPLVWQFSNQRNKCYCLTGLIKILKFHSPSHDSILIRCYSELHKAWTLIDSLWEKIDLGFVITKDLSEVDPSESNRYLNESVVLKKETGLTSTSIADTYLLAIKLCINSFEGVILIKSDLTIEINQLRDLITNVSSCSKKLRLWNSIGLKLYAKNKIDTFRLIVKEYINPILNSYSTNKDEDYQDTICEIAPTLFHFHPISFFERIELFPREARNMALINTTNYILTKTIIEEDNDSAASDNAFELTYEEHKDICLLTDNIVDNDFQIYSNIEELVKSVKAYKIPVEQKNDIIGRISSIIKKKFPSKSTGIKHDGYLVIANAQILSLSLFNKPDWDRLIHAARLIPNLSDKAFVISILSEIITSKNKTLKSDILQESIDAINKIPSIYDRSRRFDYAWKVSHDIGGKTLFEKIGKDWISSILKNDDGSESNVKNLIDTAQKYNPNLAEYITTIVDQDPARKKMKSSITNRIKENQIIKDAKTNFSLLRKLNEQDISKLFVDNLNDLNFGTYNCKEIDSNLLNILDTISKISLKSSFNAASFFIKNAILKYTTSSKHHSILEEIHKATIENAKLVDLLSLDSIVKMENRFKYDIPQTSQNIIVRIGERDKGINFIKNWLEDNLKDTITIIDPYFSDKELFIIKIIQQIAPKCQITVLTSKENDTNCYDNNENYYNLEWTKISAEPPPDTLIQIVWLSSTKKSPFHDRWIICEDMESGLKLGTSIHGIGVAKDSTIDNMPTENVINTKNTIISDYINKRIRAYGEHKLSYSSFQLS